LIKLISNKSSLQLGSNWIDLQNASLQDVKDFTIVGMFNNVTLTIAGDFDSTQAKHGYKNIL
jgi:hypothetical protein